MTWRARGWIQLVAATALLAAACGANNGPATANHAPQTSPSPTGTVASSPSSGSMCDPSHHCLAMVTLRGSDQLVIRDLTDIAHPKTIGTAGRASELLGYGPALEGAGGQFVSSSEIAYLGGQTDPYYALPNTLFRRPISGTPSPVVVRGDKAVFLFVWRPDGSVAYLTTADLGLELHVLSGGREWVLATLPALGVRGCEVGPFPGPLPNPAHRGGFRLGHSPPGAPISLVGRGIHKYLGGWTAPG